MPFCPKCGTENNEDARFCKNCASPLATSPSINPAPRPRSSFARFVRKTFFVLLGLLAAFAVLGFLVAMLSTPGKTPLGSKIPQSETTPPASLPSGKKSAWRHQKEVSSFDDSTTHLISVEGIGDVQGWLTAKTPSLVIVCRERKLSIYVETGFACQPELGKYSACTVRMRVDSKKAFTRLADESTNSQALFIQQPIDLYAKMLEHDTLTFGFTPFNSNPAEVVFPITGVEEASAEIQKACKV